MPMDAARFFQDVVAQKDITEEPVLKTMVDP